MIGIAASQPTQTGTPAATSATTSGSAGASGTGGLQQLDFMKLIVAQMTNLNPLDPSSGSDGMPLMMQAESLNQLTQLLASLKDLQIVTASGNGAALLGRTITGLDAVTGASVTGVVTAVKMDQGQPLLALKDGSSVRLADVEEVAS
jgi:flagellar basal-body rod modification protein FlgD